MFIRLVLDDSPTKRYGRKIEGAGYHHNPTPGRTNVKTCFGHSWVVAVIVVTHPAFGEISFPVSVLRLLPGSEPILRARTEQIQWNPASVLKLLGF